MWLRNPLTEFKSENKDTKQDILLHIYDLRSILTLFINLSGKLYQLRHRPSNISDLH